MTPKKEMWLVINESIEENSDRWYTSEDFAEAVMEALEKAGFVPTSVEYRACVDATLLDPEDGETYTDGLVCFEREDREMAEADLAVLRYRGDDVVSEDKYLERKIMADWKRVR